MLEHYADEPLKEQAARFLIEHMDAQYAFGGEAVEQYGNCMDSLFRHCNGDRVFWIMKYDTLLQRIGTELSLCQQQKLPDTQTLTAGFLTEQIDSAFTLWQQNWTRQYSFDTFCRYVLPYRVGHERTGNWRRTFVTPVGIRAEYRTAAPNTTYAYGIANNILGSMRSEIYYPPQFLPDLPLEALAHVKSASCKEYAHLCVTLLRAHGLAATVDFTPQWGNRSMGHEWCVFFPDDHTAIPFNPGERLGDHFMKRKEDRLPKVFRTTYEKRPESLCMQNQGREAIPEVFDTPCLIDVTREYTQTADIEVPSTAACHTAAMPIWPYSTTKTGASCTGESARAAAPRLPTWPAASSTCPCSIPTNTASSPPETPFSSTRPGRCAPWWPTRPAAGLCG